MFGRVPNFMPMEMAPQTYAPPQAYAPQPYAAQPYVAPAPRPQPSNTAHPAPMPHAHQPAPRTWRGQEGEEPRLQLPSPEHLGLHRPAAPAAVHVDWAAVHQRLDRLGATCFHMEKMARGARVTCLLPTAKVDCSHRIEAIADSEAEAVSLAVAQAEQWASGK